MSPKKYKFTVVGLLNVLKVSKFQNEFIKSSFLPKYESNIVRISALYYSALQGRNPSNFWFIYLVETMNS